MGEYEPLTYPSMPKHFLSFRKFMEDGKRKQRVKWRMRPRMVLNSPSFLQKLLAFPTRQALQKERFCCMASRARRWQYVKLYVSGQCVWRTSTSVMAHVSHNVVIHSISPLLYRSSQTRLNTLSLLSVPCGPQNTHPPLVTRGTTPGGGTEGGKRACPDVKAMGAWLWKTFFRKR